MTHKATLYVGVASPLVEVYRLWLAKVPERDSKEERLKLLKAFPHREIGAYGLELAAGPSGPEALVFRTPLKVNPDRVKELIKEWGDEEPEQLPTDSHSPISPLDHRRYLGELNRVFDGQPVRLVARVGLTLQSPAGSV